MTRATRILTVAFGLAVSVSCTVGPDYVRPPVAVPPAYKEAADAKTHDPRAELPRGGWWELFGDAELSALVAQVDVSNQTIRAAEARVRQAQALVEIARAPNSPALNAGATNQKIGLAAGWEIDLWGRIRRSVEASTAIAESSADELEAAKLSLQAQLAQNYFLLRVQDAEIRLLQDNVARYERSLQLTRNQYAVGVASRGDVVQAEAQLMSTRAQALEAAVARAQLEHAIAVLIGKPPAEFGIAATPMNATFPAVPPALPSELLERRPDIAAAERRMAAANAQIGVAEAAYYPSVRLFAGGGFDINFAGGVAAAQFLFDGGLRQAQSAQATAAYDETVANYRQTVLGAFREVEDNLAALRIMENEAAVQAAAVRAARESVTITNNQYRAGIVNYLSVVVVQAAALINERAELGILGRRLVASVTLIKALGGGWEVETPKAAQK
jgi:NodT family efflux transporter outer membrane factor (OMF) lipoprotein